MRKAASKALYLFLCAILGMVLFTMLHRAIFVLYDLLIYSNYTFAFGMSAAIIQAIDFFALLLALFFGGWYGTTMGIDWYAMVYGPNAEKPAGLFHGFVPHNWRGKKAKKSSTPSKMAAAASVVASVPSAISTTVKVPVQEVAKAANKVVAEVHKQAVREWSFDDLITPKPAAKKTVAKKTVAKKTTRKPVAKKKVTKIDKSE